jgi:glucose-6-phosphate isomerase
MDSICEFKKLNFQNCFFSSHFFSVSGCFLLPTMTLGCWTAAQAWAILTRHAREEIASLRLQELCRDDDRVSSLVAVHNTSSNSSSNDHGAADSRNTTNHILIADLSRQRMTLETLNHLLKLTMARNLRQFITKLAWGHNCDFRHRPIQPRRADAATVEQQSQEAAAAAATTTKGSNTTSNAQQQNNNIRNKTARFQGEPNELHRGDGGGDGGGHDRLAVDTRQQQQQQQLPEAIINDNVLPSMHLALRAPKGCKMLLTDGSNACDEIHATWDRIQRLSEAIRKGHNHNFRGITDKRIVNVVVVGRGVAIAALQFVHAALQCDERAVLASRAGLEMEHSKNYNSHAGSNSSTTTATAAAAAAAVSAGSQAASSAARMIRRTVTGNSGINSSSSNNVNVNSSISTNGHPPPTPPPARQLRFLSSVDPLAAARIMRELDPATTLVISLALLGNEETGLATKMLKTWLLQQPQPKQTTKHPSQSQAAGPQHQQHPTATDNVLLAKHMMLVTGNDHIASVINKPESVHLIPHHSRCEAFTTFSAASLLPLSIVYGWSPVCVDFLAGAHDMDTHFVETNPRHNIPVLLALSDIWNNIFLGGDSGERTHFSTSSGVSTSSSAAGVSRIIVPCTLGFGSYPAFVGALEAQTCGNTAASRLGQHQQQQTSNGIRNSSVTGSALVIDGGLNGAYDRAYYQSDKIFNSELVTAMDIQLNFNTAATGLNPTGRGTSRQHSSSSSNSNLMDGFRETQDSLMCSVFAHADELAFGCDKMATLYDHLAPSPMSSIAGGGGGVGNTTESSANAIAAAAAEISHGNRPSTLLMCGKLDAFACGQLVALAEHRALVKAHLWGIDPFASEVGCSLRMQRTEELRDELQALFIKGEAATTTEESETEQAEGASNMSTRTILQHYADLVRAQRAPTI